MARGHRRAPAGRRPHPRGARNDHELIVYGQLILEQAKIVDLDPDVVDTIFEVLVRDFSANAVTMHGKSGANDAQRAWAVGAARAPITADDRFAKMWAEVAGLSTAYAMKP